MSGTIAVAPNDLAPLNSGMFYWVVDTLAEEVQDPRVRVLLTDISEHRLGYLAMWPDPSRHEFEDVLTPSQAGELTETARRTLVPRAERDFADRPAFRDEAVDLLNDLVERMMSASARYPW